MNREYHKSWSHHLQRDMELLVFGDAGAKVLVFPTRCGRFYEYEKIGVINALKEKIAGGFLQFFCVDSVDAEGLYCAHISPTQRIARQQAYEKYILHEVFPFIHAKNPHQCLISHGLSLGAYHAANMVFRHPQHFKKLVAFSGRYDLTLSVECFSDLFEGFYNEDIYFHTPTHFLPNLNCELQLNLLRRIEITLVIGNEDPFLENNQCLSAILAEKNIPHQLIYWNGRAHTGHYWKKMAPLYL
jgi:esterase/lipase superfamily enzyme